MIVENQMECRLVAGETEVLGENLPQRHFCLSQNPKQTNQKQSMAVSSGPPIVTRLLLLPGVQNEVPSLYYPTSRKVAGSSPDEVDFFFFQFT
jgi:hypothetical protein